MLIYFSKYEGTGNDFVIIDNRKNIINATGKSLIEKLCNRRFGIGADGLILLNGSDKYDFEMVYFNADGNPGSMCGNGGRCIAAFAKRLDIIKTGTVFCAADGVHHARIEKYDEHTFNATVYLKMHDVKNIEKGENYFFLDTGSPHYVKLVEVPGEMDVVAEGKRIRYSERFRGEGTNVNFISIKNNIIHIRSYERGVEDETLSCGTGAVASALAAAENGLLADQDRCELITKGGKLMVHFKKNQNGFENIFLEGPATFVFDGQVEI